MHTHKLIMAADSRETQFTEELPESVILWDEREVVQKQIEQIGASACGATAVLNVLKLFGRNADLDLTAEAVKTRLRHNHSPLPEYLLSRSVAGTTHEGLIEGISQITRGEIVGRFFHMYPERDFDLSSWLRCWLVKGVVPLATLNCQQIPLEDGTIPDAWHHQVICGVSKKGVHMANPDQVLPFDVITKQLCSDSVLLIRRQDVLQRWSDAMDYSCWSSHNSESKWTELKCKQQIDRLVKEETLLLLHGSKLKHRELLTAHITIPAAYKSGVTLFALQSTKASSLLKEEKELPVKDGKDGAYVQSSCNEDMLSVNV